jgi:hypothetical protein
MNKKFIAFIFVFFAFIFSFSFKVIAQKVIKDTVSVKVKPTLSGTLAQQYVEVVVRSGSYKVYKNIKKTKIEEFWKNINDTLNYQKQLNKQGTAAPIQNDGIIKTLQSKIDSLEEVKTEKRVYGGENPVSIYLWLALIALSFALVFALVRTRVAIKEASYRIELYDQLFEELRENRIKATEREKKLGRELQTERNRVEELLEKGKNIN